MEDAVYTKVIGPALEWVSIRVQVRLIFLFLAMPLKTAFSRISYISTSSTCVLVGAYQQT